MTLRLTLLLALLVFIGAPVSGQSDGQGTTLIKIDGGVLWAHNEDDAHFTVEIKGSEIRMLQEYPYMSVDGRPMQLRLVPIEDFLDMKNSRPKDGAILKAHQDWEAAHHSEFLKTKLSLRSETIQLGADREALFWDYENPAQMRQSFDAQSFLTTALGRHILLVNAPRLSGESQNAARDFLVAILSSLKISPTRIDIKALQESIRKSDKSFDFTGN